jgi:hypothetical protein
VARRARLPALAALAAAVCCPAPAAADSNRLYVNAADDRPGTVDSARLYDLADRSAGRWELAVVGNAGDTPGVRDGTQVLGFSSATNPKALGVTTVWTRVRYRVKTSRRCWRKNGKRRCRTVRRNVKVGTSVVEKDVQLNPFVPWQQGPAYPSTQEYDLESTVLHELGHFAHPRIENHVFGCQNSPMINSISPGEFWRDPDEWLRYGCTASTGPKLRLGPAARPRMRMLHVEHRLPPLRVG